MSVRAVVVPATALLVPGASGGTHVLENVRRVVDDALAELVSDAGAGTLLVLAHGPAAERGPRRPSLRGAGIPDEWVPAVRAWPGVPGEPGGVAASVALLCLADALAARGDLARVDDVVIREVPAAADVGDVANVAVVADVADDVARAAGVVVAGGGAPGTRDDGPSALAPGVERVLKQVVSEQGWVPDVRRVSVHHEHLPAEYQVTLFRD